MNPAGVSPSVPGRNYTVRPCGGPTRKRAAHSRRGSGNSRRRRTHRTDIGAHPNAAAARDGEQSQLAVARLAEQKTQHRTRVGCSQPLGLGHGHTLPAAPATPCKVIWRQQVVHRFAQTKEKQASTSSSLTPARSRLHLIPECGDWATPHFTAGCPRGSRLFSFAGSSCHPDQECPLEPKETAVRTLETAGTKRIERLGRRSWRRPTPC